MKGVFERFARFGFLWATALRDLREATSITIIGASLPPSDYVLRWLIRESRQRMCKNPHINIVNPDREAALISLSLFSSSTGSWFLSLEDFLNNKVAEDISLPSTFS